MSSYLTSSYSPLHIFLTASFFLFKVRIQFQLTWLKLALRPVDQRSIVAQKNPSLTRGGFVWNLCCGNDCARMRTSSALTVIFIHIQTLTYPLVRSIWNCSEMMSTCTWREVIQITKFHNTAKCKKTSRNVIPGTPNRINRQMHIVSWSF